MKNKRFVTFWSTKGNDLLYIIFVQKVIIRNYSSLYQQ